MTTRVLFICEGNLHRSPTAESLYSKTNGLRISSAGLAQSARIQVTDELIVESDLIFVMEKRLQKILRQRFVSALADKTLICLNIPNEYQFRQPELLKVLTERLTPSLGAPSV